MRIRARMLHSATLALCLLASVFGRAQAQNSRDTERRLESIKRELSTVASERRSIEGQRGDASRQLRQAGPAPAGPARAAARRVEAPARAAACLGRRVPE